VLPAGEVFAAEAGLAALELVWVTSVRFALLEFLVPTSTPPRIAPLVSAPTRPPTKAGFTQPRFVGDVGLESFGGGADDDVDHVDAADEDEVADATGFCG
jgi:hypothetical protein